MKVLRFIVNLENHRDLRIEVLDIQCGVVSVYVKAKPVGTCAQVRLHQEEWFYPTVVVGPGFSKSGPALVRVLQFELYMYATCGSAARSIKDMR